MDQTHNEIEKIFSPKDIETKWYTRWEEGKYFKARKGKQHRPFSIVMPLPNVTGRLHVGHALDATTQDAIIRFKRMKGYETLWLPGTDHAGIATQAVVEKLVWEKEKKTRHQFTKEEFVEKIWQWKREYGNIILDQQKSLGASADWDYAMFTLDPDANKAVREFFVNMYNEKLIYQANYIINWDTTLQSAISDAEVEHKEVKGNFYHILYQVEGSDEKLEIATTRPETLLGDTAVAINPNDDRYKHLIGKKAIIPICNRVVPILADEYVDIDKGTGCLKVTPGHDFNDFELGKRHNLEIVNILNKDGTLNENGLQYKGLTCSKARLEIIKELEHLEILKEIKEHIHQVGHGERSGTVIEPMVSRQWFLNVQKMAKQGIERVTADTTRFFPKGWENTYFAWLKEPRDWCISRQLWWGHQIPVYYCKKCHYTWASKDEPSGCTKCDSSNFYQDPDVLDTWFSSGLWPLTLLGWPNPERMRERKFDTFYPTSTLITGYDIIFFWVARMMMMCDKAIGNVPFNHVYIHAIVRDKFGRKMSKSLGNGIDPLEIVGQYGADALRFTLTAGSGYNRNLNLDPERISGYRNFMNKVWNAFRFVHPFLNTAEQKLPTSNKLAPHERWIISELNSVIKIVNDSMEEYRYDDASAAIYSFVYDKFCSWFIELSKNILYSEDQKARAQRATVLKFTFKKIVAILHPFAPFITEELWSYLKSPQEDLLIVADFPEFTEELVFADDQNNMNRFIEIVSLIRNLRASVDIKPKDLVNVEIFTEIVEVKNYLQNNLANLQDLAKIKSMAIKNRSDIRPKKSIMAATSFCEIFIPLEGFVDIAAQVQRLQKDLQKAQKEFDKYNGKLSNENFIKNAPEDVVAEVKHNASEFAQKIAVIRENIQRFN
ncbi:MAG: valine--tRNA ligase [Bdellovibrionales bacterium RIFOXYD12_FULL_39_22]|nr:MAG: valine--tRNA ligase [Bdellovibrionales bacterium RIFOXYB1_FULL_39_21]OFZ43622.1 MAG: valine--tRNA ligase [Bdellovibrionales bacterium RIFOXYC12_FULL_39_17]OFZ44641.1 MAG: valine--tRNA ligase [Bdellovibrionales bacterium RIFOXYC1_FULL_39_130]OFZ76400.1 MAG: valine--tRNA ligase [Bdellovibrionales bacterium RIFOXYD1_FULL_39_84]OFZ94666.1 MAG: valine--tRNA ligase [Bdellovibrionales bacterium RIFOXYD12_FULL_39_22]HLE12876.1 valine--tRNA ligase [Bacteriovoracaceae bacterium]